MLRPIALALLFPLSACGSDPARDDRVPAPDTASASGSTAPGTAAAVAAGGARPACPATGAWTPCAVLERLERAGLAPRAESSAVTEPPLTATGTLLRVGTVELELYLYASTDARRRDIARVDTTRYLGYTEAVSMQQLPTLIQNANLIAVLHSRNDHQRERVGDALTAGPPQPSDATRLPPASTSRTTP